jgi:membrane-associated phospholipid phosphatase
MVVLLCLSTVYCRYHYVVDVAAGILTAAVLVPLGNWFYFRFRGRAERQLAKAAEASQAAASSG